MKLAGIMSRTACIEQPLGTVNLHVDQEFSSYQSIEMYTIRTGKIIHNVQTQFDCKQISRALCIDKLLFLRDNYDNVR